jgi:hypothetical protein
VQFTVIGLFLLRNLEMKKSPKSHKETVQQITEDNRRFWASRKVSPTPKPKNQLPLAETPETYWKMSCDHCKGEVEFPASGLGQTALCPHCGLEITLHHSPLTPYLGKGRPTIVHLPPSYSAGTNNKPSFKLGFVGWCVIALILFFGAGFFLNTYFPQSSAVNDANSDQVKDAAYLAAKTFVTKAYPGAKSFSSRSDSPVRVTGGALYSVTLVVDGVNSFNAPIRQVMLVSETHTGDEWHLLSIEQSE